MSLRRNEQKADRLDLFKDDQSLSSSSSLMLSSFSFSSSMTGEVLPHDPNVPSGECHGTPVEAALAAAAARSHSFPFLIVFLPKNHESFLSRSFDFSTSLLDLLWRSTLRVLFLLIKLIDT